MNNDTSYLRGENVALVLLLASLIGCGGNSTSTQRFSITISPSSVNLAAEASQQFSATVTHELARTYI